MKCARSSFFQCAAPYLVAMGRIGSAALHRCHRENGSLTLREHEKQGCMSTRLAPESSNTVEEAPCSGCSE